MSEFYSIGENQPSGVKRLFTGKYSFIINILLLVITFFTTTVAGVAWILGPAAAFDLSNFSIGLPYSISILFILSSHEFGHYFAARSHRVKATLPYFFPFPLTEFFLNFGTLGAVIKTQSPVPNKKAMFDIGVAGPIAGFIASIIVLIYGFTHLPGIEFILRIHPDYFLRAVEPGGLALEFGPSLMYLFLEKLFTNPSLEFVPPMSEIYHYPYLCTGWFGMFVTAMNLIPVGQLDGGHISYSLFGSRTHRLIANISFALLVALGIAGLSSELFGLNISLGWTGWLLWALILKFVVRLYHPEILSPEELDPRRKLIGYLAILIFILSFIPVPFYISF